MLIFCLLTLVNVGYWLVLGVGYGKAVRRTESKVPAPRSVSIVIAARNEAHNLPILRHALAAQHLQPHQVVVVDDHSDDSSPEILRQWQNEDPRLTVVRVAQPVFPRKKNALSLGIGAATGDLLVFTDADCRPEAGWLQGMLYRKGTEPTVVVGYGPYRKAPGLLNRFVRYETFITGTLMASAIGLGRPFMAVGRNLAYPRSLFAAAGGFAHSMDALGGDDDLFVQHVHRYGLAQVLFASDPGTFVESDAPADMRRWLHQKRRHTAAGRRYDRWIAAHLAIFHGTHLAVWLAPLFLGWHGLFFPAARLLMVLAVLGIPARRFGESDLLPILPFLDVLYLLYQVVVAPLGVLVPPRRW